MKHPAARTPRRWLLAGAGIVLGTTLAQADMTYPGATAQRSPGRPIATYSIVARDPSTGELGVAVQSHWFSVGSVVPWVQSGVGAVATQAMADPAYGPLGLHLMQLGRSAPDALKGALAADEGRELRQVAMIDAAGKVAAHTGTRCIADAGMIVDEANQFAVQANLMANDRVWSAMAAAYRDARGDLAERLLAALDAAQAAGGDIRGRQSAAIVVANAVPSGKPWLDRKFDLRVEDHPEPLVELRRLVTIQRAYLHMNAGDLAMESNDLAQALKEYALAEQHAPQIVEVSFWQAVTLASAGRLEQALPVFRRVFEREPPWAEVVPRLVRAGLLPDDRALVDRILAQARTPR